MTTKQFDKREDGERFEDQRRRRIAEAISWSPGPSLDNQERYLVDVLPDGSEAYFLKPGKEAFREAKRNIHDMVPGVAGAYKRASFLDIWEVLSDISVADFESFRIVLLLIYRNAFHIDHVETGGRIRYGPAEPISKQITALDNELVGILPKGGLLGFLAFLDLLGWTEDVKYHTKDNMPNFSKKRGYRVGRVNTLLTHIRVAYQMSTFVRDVLNEATHPKDVDFRPAYELMQQFANSRGTCTPTGPQLIDWLTPYLRTKDESLDDY